MDPKKAKRRALSFIMRKIIWTIHPGLLRAGGVGVIGNGRRFKVILAQMGQRGRFSANITGKNLENNPKGKKWEARGRLPKDFRQNLETNLENSLLGKIGRQQRTEKV